MAAVGSTAPVVEGTAQKERVQADASWWGMLPGCGVLGRPSLECWGLSKREQLRLREAGGSEFLEILASGSQTWARGTSLSQRKQGTVKGGSEVWIGH